MQKLKVRYQRLRRRQSEEGKEWGAEPLYNRLNIMVPKDTEKISGFS
jgi:hypothetical protein